jgi:hypothetical protein
LATEWPLGSLPAANVELLGIELGLPLVVGLFDFFCHCWCLGFGGRAAVEAIDAVDPARP